MPKNSFLTRTSLLELCSTFETGKNFANKSFASNAPALYFGVMFKHHASCQLSSSIYMKAVL